MLDSNSDSKTRVIRPQGGAESFWQAIGSIGRDFPHARSLAWRMLLRDVRAMYRQSLLGYFWMVMPPLATTLIWVFLNGQKLVQIDSGNVPFPIFVLTGTLLWSAFNGAVMNMLSLFNTSRALLSKVNFPHESLVITAMGKSVLDGLVPTILLIPALPFYSIPFAPTMVLFPFGLLCLLFLGGTIGLLAVPIAALYHDIGRAIQLALRLGFFLTPVIYPLPQQGWSHTFLVCNPVSSILVTSRTWLVGSGPTLVPQMATVLALCSLTFALAVLAYKVAMPLIIERLNS